MALTIWFLPQLTLAQTNLPVFQSTQSPVTPGHLGAWITDGVLGDSGPATNGNATELGITNSGTPLCINDAPVGSPSGYHELCFGANALGGGILSYQAYGGASPLPFQCNINGTAGPCLNEVTGLPAISSEAVLAATETTFATVVVLTGYYAQGDEPPVLYHSSSTPCATADAGAQVSSPNNGCWIASLDPKRLDVRIWGAKADGTTPADTAFTNARLYASARGACVYVPSQFPGFALNASFTMNDVSGSDCLVGDRGWKNFPTNTGRSAGTFYDISFPNNSSGIIVAANNGAYVGHIAIKGNAYETTSTTNTVGLSVSGFEVKVEDVFIQDFVTCKGMVGTVNRVSLRDIVCDDQGGYPNVFNHYPFVCEDLTTGNPTAAAFQETGAECRAAAGSADAVYVADGSTAWFQVCAPGTFNVSGTKPTGTPLNCTGPTEYNSAYLFAARGIKVRQGSSPPLPNGQGTNNAPITACNPSVYTIWDISAAGGAGSGGTQLYCNVMSATLTSGSTTVVVGSTSGIPSGTNILVSTAEGIPLETTIVSITDGTHLVMSNPAYVTGSISLTITQQAVATSGPPNYAAGCRSAAGQGTYAASCGYAIEIRFASPPASGQVIDLQWQDPTGKAAYWAGNVGDYVFLRPTIVGGYSYGLLHTGLSDGGIEYRPTYVEIGDYCAIVGRVDGATTTAPYGDVVVINRVVNDPIPACPGYFDPVAQAGLRVVFNGASYYDPASFHPGYVVGNWYWPTPSFNRNLVASASNTIYCVRMLVGPGSLPKALAVNVESGGAGNVNMALYTNNPSTHRPGRLLATTGGQSVGSSGTIAGTLAYTYNATLMPEGNLWACSLFDTASVNVSGEEAINGTNPLIDGGWSLGNPSGFGTVISSGQSTGVTVSHSFASGFPATLIGVTSDAGNQLPLVGWQD